MIGACTLAMLLISFTWLIALFRFVSFVLLLATWFAYIRFVKTKHFRRFGLCWTLTALSLISPLDITLLNLPGPPRVIPLVMGLPTQATAERARNGEVLLGGCITSGMEPKYVVVW